MCCLFIPISTNDQCPCKLCHVKVRPHGSDKWPVKKCNEICHSLCMPHGSDKSWQIIKKKTNKNLNMVKNLVHLSDI